MTTTTVESAVSLFGERTKGKLANVGASGQPEDQLRSPFESLLQDMSALTALAGAVEAVGESSVASLKTRPDYAVTVKNALVGFVELKAPGKGADPRKFKDPHDKDQWERLRSLPNLLYTDGNSFSLWQNGELACPVLMLIGDVESSGKKLMPPPGFAALFESFLRWQPVPPRSAKELAHTTARLCRLLRDEVTEQLALKSEALTSLAEDWRKLLFPEATDARFADGYAQAVTFGLLMARAKKIVLSTGLQKVATDLAKTSSLIGAALRLLTDNAANQETLKTALGTLIRVLDAVDWDKISKGNPDAWLYFYEDFLEVYDNDLRKLTGSYYTPPEVVGAMVGLVNEALKSTRYGLHAGLASSAVTLADPATGTGTFVLGVLRSIAETVRADEGEGAVPAAIQEALKRLIAFEMQLGPFAVAQLRILAEVVELTGSMPKTAPRMYVTNTLSDPEEESGWIPAMLAPIANQRKDANKIMREETITVVIGNPPYKHRAEGEGSWVENGAKNSEVPAPLQAWMPPEAWGMGAHSKHLKNLYIYFWRWATWKVFDLGDGKKRGPHEGIVCFITVAGFLNGPGFQKMRTYLRETCDEIWIIDCSPEGYQPEVNTRIFQGVQQPVCIVMASRSKKKREGSAVVNFLALPRGRREDKFAALTSISLNDAMWTICSDLERAPFRPVSSEVWESFPKLDELFIYNGAGIQAKRTWVFAPDKGSLQDRWDTLLGAPLDKKEELFHPTLRKGIPADRHIRSVIKEPIPGYRTNPSPIINETGRSIESALVGFRSFDRQFVITDRRVITQPNDVLWESASDRQIYAVALSSKAPTSGPALTFSALVPENDFYKGSFSGRVFPLWLDREATSSNVPRKLLQVLSETYGSSVSSEDLMAYVAGVAAHPEYTSRFTHDLSTPGLRVPITVNYELFKTVVSVGRTVVWLHTFGERMVDVENGRPAHPPRLPVERRPAIPKAGAISQLPEDMPDAIGYDAEKQHLLVGQGFIENVTPDMWVYDVSGKQVVIQWFSYRKRNRERPIIGDRRRPSPLGDIQPDHWLPEYTTELLNVLNVLGLLIDLEPQQAELLERVCSGPLISADDLKSSKKSESTVMSKRRKKLGATESGTLF